LDPITIGLAFTAAQSAVSHIKQAIALGKDVHSLVGQFSKFFQSADAIHRERMKVTAKASRLGKTDAELGHEALQIAIHSDALRQAERELKDTIIWTLGKPEVWEQMIKERTRLFKERAEAERAEEERKLAHKKKIAEQFMFAMYFIGVAIFLFCASMVGIGIYGAMEDKRIYEQKVAERNLVLRRQAKEREAAEKQELSNYASESR
jgi:hypothetical protein